MARGRYGPCSSTNISNLQRSRSRSGLHILWRKADHGHHRRSVFARIQRRLSDSPHSTDHREIVCRCICVTPSGPSGLVYDNRYGTPYIANWPSGLQPVSTGFPCRIIFFIPTNLLALQKVTVSFALVAFRSGQQSTSAGGSAHNHSVSGQTASATTSGNQGANHLHTITINSGLAGNTVFYDSLGVGLQASTGGTVGTSTENATHTHGIPAETVSAATSSSDSTHTHALNAPNAIYETGAASGATVILDGTTILAGPYNADQFELDITQFLTGSGKHEVQITSTALGGIFGHVQVIGLVKSN